MVYSSSGISALLQVSDPFAVIGPQAFWAVSGAIVLIIFMRLDYRYLRLISVPAYILALILLVVVLLPQIGPIKPVEVGGSTRWLEIGPLPRMHPAEFAKLALVVYLAHWLAKRGTKASSLFDGLIPFLLITGPLLFLVFLEPDLGTMGVLTVTAFTMFFVAGGSLWQLALVVPAATAALAFLVSNSAYQMARVQAFLESMGGPAGHRLPHRPGTARAGNGRGSWDRPGRKPAARPAPPARCPDGLRLRGSRAGARFHRRRAGDRLLPVVRIPWHQDRASSTGHIRGPACHRHHGMADASGVHQHRRGRGPAADHRHHAAVRLAGRLVPARLAGRGGHPAFDIPGDATLGSLE